MAVAAVALNRMKSTPRFGLVPDRFKCRNGSPVTSRYGGYTHDAYDRESRARCSGV